MLQKKFTAALIASSALLVCAAIGRAQLVDSFQATYDEPYGILNVTCQSDPAANDYDLADNQSFQDKNIPATNSGLSVPSLFNFGLNHSSPNYATLASAIIYGDEDSGASNSQAQGAPSYIITDEAGRFHFDIGLSYVNGIEKVDNALKSEVDATGASYSSVVIPVGLQLDPYYLFDFGLGIGATVGPTEIISVSNADAGFEEFGDNNDNLSGVIPVGADLRYEFVNTSGFMPYVRAGFRYPIPFGNNISHGQVGFFGAGGVEFTQVHLGLEVSYDTSTVDVTFAGATRTVEPSGLMVTLYAHF